MKRSGFWMLMIILFSAIISVNLLSVLVNKAIADEPTEIIKWKCGNPPTTPPQYDKAKWPSQDFHMEVSEWKAKTYVWSECTHRFLYNFKNTIRDWSVKLIEDMNCERHACSPD